jgi:hypothetical protein
LKSYSADFGAFIPLTRAFAPLSGEIDVLAIHPRGYVIVAECKVLALPGETARLLNIYGKLSLDDAESFRAKLGRKVAWVDRVAGRLAPTYQSTLGMIVLDRFLPGSVHDGPELVVHLSRLDAAIANLLAKNAAE